MEPIMVFPLGCAFFTCLCFFRSYLVGREIRRIERLPPNREGAKQEAEHKADLRLEQWRSQVTGTFLGIFSVLWYLVLLSSAFSSH